MTLETMERGAALREIRSPEAAARERAARALARWADADVVRALAEAVADSSTTVREAAASSLLAVGGVDAVVHLVPLIRSDSPSVRNHASSLLEHLGRAEPEALHQLSKDPDPRMRLFAANIMAGTGDHDFAPRLIELLRDPDLNVQDAAVTGLGRMRASSAVPSLTDRLRESDPWARFSTIDALGRIGTAQALRALLDAAPEAEMEMRVAFVEAIGATGLPDAATGLLALLSQRLDLGPIVAKELLGPLAPTLRLPALQTPGVVALLADALLRSTPAEVLRGLESPAMPVRAAAVEAARARWLTDAIPILCRLRSDPDSRIRSAAGAALTSFEDARKERQ
jgi:HEAT repeat protein